MDPAAALQPMPTPAHREPCGTADRPGRQPITRCRKTCGAPKSVVQEAGDALQLKKAARGWGREERLWGSGGQMRDRW